MVHSGPGSATSIVRNAPARPRHRGGQKSIAWDRCVALIADVTRPSRHGPGSAPRLASIARLIPMSSWTFPRIHVARAALACLPALLVFIQPACAAESAPDPARAPAVVSAAPNDPRPRLLSQILPWDELVVKATANGQRRDVFNAPTATLLELECHVTTLLPGKAAHAPHRHPWEEIIIIKEGTIEVQLNGQVQRVGPGSVLFYAPNDPHGLRNVGDTVASYHVLTWKSRDTQPGKSTQP